MTGHDRTWLEIDIERLRHNARAVISAANGKKIMAVVKANAYGHGARIVCDALGDMPDISHFAVSSIDEAAEIADIAEHYGKDILIFGYTPPEALSKLHGRFILSVGSLAYGRDLSAAATARGITIRAHIKIDSGMSRVGIDSREELERILSLPGLLPEGLYTHFASADSLAKEDLDFTDRQYDKFLNITTGIGLPIHSQNSGGILYHDSVKSDIARAGIILYGLPPGAGTAVPIDIKPVLTLKTTVCQVKLLRAGSAVSYGGRFVAERAMSAAVLPIGYADGYFRAFSNKGTVLINGVPCPVLGTVCMDAIIADVSAASAKPGDTALVYSDKHELTSIPYNAALIDTISYELICALRRMPRYSQL